MNYLQNRNPLYFTHKGVKKGVFLFAELCVCVCVFPRARVCVCGREGTRLIWKGTQTDKIRGESEQQRKEREIK